MSPAKRPRGGLAAQLRQARRRAGLSGRELARRAGVSQASVSAIELGRDVEHGTLQALIDALPGLDVRSLLGRPATGPLPASKRQWRYFAKALSFRARRVALRVMLDGRGGQRTELEVAGLAMLDGDCLEPSRLLALMGIAIVGSTAATFGLRRAGLPAPGRPLEIQDEDLLHVFELSSDAARPSLSYRRIERGGPRPAGSPLPGQAPHGRPFETGACLWLDYPTERLVVRAEFAGAMPPAVVKPEAWPASMGVDPDHPASSWAALHPHAPRWIAVNARGVAELRLDHPLPGLCLGLSWGHADAPLAAAASPVLVRPREPKPLAQAIVDAREGAGLSGRALARRLQVSPATLLAIENGSEPRLSTLRSLSEALPELSPFQVFLPHDGSGELDLAEAWSAQRELFGMEALEEITRMTVNRDGDLRADMTTEGLSWTRAAAQDLRLRHGLTRVPEGSTWQLDAILSSSRAGAAEPKVRVLRRGIGPVVHELRFETASADGRVSFTRKLSGKGQFQLTAARARAAGQAPRPWEALYVEPSLPARRLSVDLRFPKGLFPPALRVRVVPRASVLAPPDEDLRDRIHPGGLRFVAEAGASRARLEVERPLVGLRYVFTWSLA